MKADINKYIPQAVLKNNANSQQLVITSVSGHTSSNRNKQFEDNNHEEADTLMIRGCKIHCPDARDNPFLMLGNHIFKAGCPVGN